MSPKSHISPNQTARLGSGHSAQTLTSTRLLSPPNSFSVGVALHSYRILTHVHKCKHHCPSHSFAHLAVHHVILDSNSCYSFTQCLALPVSYSQPPWHSALSPSVRPYSHSCCTGPVRVQHTHTYYPRVSMILPMIHTHNIIVVCSHHCMRSWDAVTCTLLGRYKWDASYHTAYAKLSIIIYLLVWSCKVCQNVCQRSGC